MAKPPVIFSPRWWRILRLILREWREHRKTEARKEEG